MSLAPLVGAAVVGGALVLVLRDRRSLAWGVGLVALGVAVVATISLGTGTMRVGGAAVTVTEYGRLLVASIAIAGLLLGLVAAAAGATPTVIAGMLVALLAVALAVCAADPALGFWAVAGGGVGALAVALLDRTTARPATVAIALRAVIAAGTVAVLGLAVAGPLFASPAPDQAILGLVYIAVAFGLALRFAAVPLHGWAARLADGVSSPLLAVTLAWLPVGLAAVATAWLEGPVAGTGSALDVERGIVLAVGLATIVLGALAALVQDDLGHTTAYLTIADGGLALIAFTVLDPLAWEPTRVWLLALAVTKTALVAWVVATEATFGTRRLPDLAGWARHSPALGAALALVAIATVGWPGSAVLAARVDLIQAAIRGPLGSVAIVALFAVLVPYGRVLAVGLRPSRDVSESIPPARLRAPAAWTMRTPGPRSDRIRAAGRDVSATWSLNRAPAGAAGVVALALLGSAIAVGAFGVSSAAGGDRPGATTEVPAESPPAESPPAESPPAESPPTASAASAASGAPIASPPAASGAPTAPP